MSAIALVLDGVFVLAGPCCPTLATPFDVFLHPRMGDGCDGFLAKVGHQIAVDYPLVVMVFRHVLGIRLGELLQAFEVLGGEFAE